jgi:hypothetical protein
VSEANVGKSVVLIFKASVAGTTTLAVALTRGGAALPTNRAPRR